MLLYIKELSDFGLMILIWLVQLIIYPSFTYFEKARLQAWHSKYTSMISIIVMPLMLVQLASTFYLIYNGFNYILLLQSILIILLWMSTFFEAVPLHKKIDSGLEIKKVIEKLVQVNWKRTMMWSAIVILNFIDRITT